MSNHKGYKKSQRWWYGALFLKSALSLLPTALHLSVHYFFYSWQDNKHTLGKYSPVRRKCHPLSLDVKQMNIHSDKHPLYPQISTTSCSRSVLIRYKRLEGKKNTKTKHEIQTGFQLTSVEWALFPFCLLKATGATTHSSWCGEQPLTNLLTFILWTHVLLIIFLDICIYYHLKQNKS